MLYATCIECEKKKKMWVSMSTMGNSNSNSDSSCNNNNQKNETFLHLDVRLKWTHNICDNSDLLICLCVFLGNKWVKQGSENKGNVWKKDA